MMNLYAFLLGMTEFSFPAEEKTRILDFFLTSGIGCRSFFVEGERGRFFLLRRDAGKLPPELGCEVLCEHGLPAALRAYGRHPGFVLGTVLGLLLLVLSSLTVWRVEVTGNDAVSSYEIEAALAEAGLSVGSFTPGVDTAAVRTRFLKSLPSVAWVGVYVRGTTVAVEVRERLPIPNEEVGGGLGNLVAGEDALVESIRVDCGRAVVSPGASVRQGELLISGLYGTPSGLVTARAEGEVRARVVHRHTVTQPLTFKEKVYEKERLASFSINFFGKTIKVCKIAGKSGEECDIINRKEQIVLFGSIRLPIYTVKEYRLSYAFEERQLSEEEAVRAAHRKMTALMTSDLAACELLRKRLFGEFTENGYLLLGETESIRDIAVLLPYTVGEQGG